MSLRIILYSGAFDRIHYGLAMAAAAAASNREVTVFITMAACRAFVPGGWQDLPLSDGVNAFPAHNARELETHYQQQGVAGFSALLEACCEFNVKFLVCEMGLKAAGLEASALDAALNATLCGIVTLLHQSPGEMVFI